MKLYSLKYVEKQVKATTDYRLNCQLKKFSIRRNILRCVGGVEWGVHTNEQESGSHF